MGRALPFGIGAVVGGVGNRLMGRAVITNAREAFGPIPDTIPGELRALAETTGPAALYESAPESALDAPADAPVNNCAPKTTKDGGTFWI